MTEEQKKQLKLLALALIIGGLGINLYLLMDEGRTTAATSSLMRPAMQSLMG